MSWEGKERRTDLVLPRLAALEERVSNIQTDLQTNIELTRKVANETQQLRELWSEARSAFSLFNRIVSSFRWCIRFVLVPVAVLLLAVYTWRHNGEFPKWFASLWNIIW